MTYKEYYAGQLITNPEFQPEKHVECAIEICKDLGVDPDAQAFAGSAVELETLPALEEKIIPCKYMRISGNANGMSPGFEELMGTFHGFFQQHTQTGSYVIAEPIALVEREDNKVIKVRIQDFSFVRDDNDSE